jgi:NAD(P)-dependent dehydrogenase (short-subunit alcohol dehydrogenase family)
MNIKELFDLTGKVAIVTGGSVGLGSQMCRALAESGANVVIAARKVERCEELANELSKLGVRALPARCDVSKFDECDELVGLTVREFGRVDILVNNAGATWEADAMDFPMDKWQRIMDINVNGLFRLCAQAGKNMKEHGGGKIINIASIAGLGGTFQEEQNTVGYNTSKAAVINLTRDLAVKWGRYKIYVNAILPGPFRTHMTEKHWDKLGGEEFFYTSTPLRQVGGSDDMKGAVVFLSSAASDHITGVSIPVDGGIHAHIGAGGGLLQ